MPINLPPQSDAPSLRPYLPAWKAITTDKWVLSIITHGYRIEFHRLPPTGLVRFTDPSPALEAEVSALLEKDAIEPIHTSHPSGFFSRYFVVEKKDGGLRPILDLRRLNRFITKRRFRMVTLQGVLPLLQKGDWFAVIDLRDAYFHISIEASHRRFLRFALGRRTFQFKALPFGLSSAPRVFTKCLAPVVAHLRTLGVTVFPYIDDWLLVAPSRGQALTSVQVTLRLLQMLGLKVNYKKSTLDPTQVVSYIGSTLDSRTARAFLPPARIGVIASLVRKFHPGASVSALLALRLLGYMASTISMVQYARLRMRPLQAWLLRAFKPHLHHVSRRLQTSRRLLASLQWWSVPHNLNRGLPFQRPSPTRQLVTDASRLGWGAHCGPLRVHDIWSREEKCLHINALELLAVWKSLQAFAPVVAGSTVLVSTDNTTAAAYINKQGGTRSRRLLNMSLAFWEWCISLRIFPIAIHIRGQDNSIADCLSRQGDAMHEWELHPQVYNLLCRKWGYPAIDLFATEGNRKCPKYCSRAGMGRRSLGDSFLHTWSGPLLYLFPPLPLLTRVLVKLRSDGSDAILIAPWWPRQPWFSLLLSLASDTFLLPQWKDLLSQTGGQVLHADLPTLRLTAWRITPP